MTYARARLWLGVAGVGSIVAISCLVLVAGLPETLFSNRKQFGGNEFLQISALSVLFMLWLLPFDFLGGYWIPAKFQRSNQTLRTWIFACVPAAVSQAALFLLFGSLIVLAGQQFGNLGAIGVVSLLMISCFVVRNHLLLRRVADAGASPSKLLDSITMIRSWQIFVPNIVILNHKDIGFSGGIIGIGQRTQVVIPKAWLSFSRGQLATAISRRAIAIKSGSYRRGLILAFVWNVAGFMVCSLFPGSGLTTVAGLVGTVCGFTVWSFFGLLLLPTLSRRASLKIDQELAKYEFPEALILTTARKIDQMQDDEPERPAWIETFFHPVPNVTSRNQAQPIRGIEAWNVARTSLFFSWACLGLLSRSVHCNVGRPELWTMLPTD